jgi:hypothetical protein
LLLAAFRHVGHVTTTVVQRKKERRRKRMNKLLKRCEGDNNNPERYLN